MPEIVPDSEIAGMIAEDKHLPWNWQVELSNLKNKAECLESEVYLVGMSGTKFRIIVRQHRIHVNNFTVVLTASLQDEVEMRLLRYDGRNHAHRNKIEGYRIGRETHIHRATERYQRLRWELHDGYAEETDRYHDLSGAWKCFGVDTRLTAPAESLNSTLPNLFTEG